METWHIYIDESCTSERKLKYMVFGGVMMRASVANELRQSITNWRSKEQFWEEIKYTKTDNLRLPVFKQFVDGMIGHSRRSRIEFRSMVVEKSTINAREHFNGDQNECYYSLMYNHVFHCFAKNLCHDDRLLIYLDQRFTKYKLSRLKLILNRGLRKELGLSHQVDVVRSLECRDSKKCDFVQMADIVAGTVALHHNQMGDRFSKRGIAKLRLADHLSQLAGFNSLCLNTPPSIRHFGVWQFRFNQQKTP